MSSASESERNLATLLFNPFRWIAGWQALLVGVAAILAAGWIGSIGHVHFDGVLDVHLGKGLPLWLFLAEGIVDWLVLAVVLAVVGRIASTTRFRVIDIVGTQALARCPTLFSAIILLAPGFQRYASHLMELMRHQGTTVSLQPSDSAVYFSAIAAMLLILVWTVALMYRSYVVSCNLRGAKAAITFIGGVLLAELFSKIVLHELVIKAL